MTWTWFGKDLFVAWGETQTDEVAASGAELLDEIANSVRFPNLPGQQHPDGPGKHVRVEERSGYRIVFVADRHTVVGALYLSSIQGPDDEQPLTRRQLRDNTGT